MRSVQYSTVRSVQYSVVRSVQYVLNIGIAVGSSVRFLGMIKPILFCSAPGPEPGTDCDDDDCCALSEESTVSSVCVIP